MDVGSHRCDGQGSQERKDELEHLRSAHGHPTWCPAVKDLVAGEVGVEEDMGGQVAENDPAVEREAERVEGEGVGEREEVVDDVDGERTATVVQQHHCLEQVCDLG